MKKIYMKPQINIISVKTDNAVAISTAALQSGYKELDIYANVISF